MFSRTAEQEGQTLDSQEAGSKRVLVVEDNELNLKLFHDLLTAHGYQVYCSKDGRQALAMARAQRPDLILMDIELPEMSGLEVTARLKADRYLSSIPVVAVTALAMSGDKERFLSAGCTAYLSKPVIARNLLETVVRLLATPQTNSAPLGAQSHSL